MRKDAGGEGVTVGVLAQRIAGDHDDARLILRQVRHWTNAGLLTPDGERHGGTGRHRRYTTIECYRAAVLAELSRWGVQVGLLAGFVETLEARRLEWIEEYGDDPLRRAAAGELIDVVIVVLRGRGGGYFVDVRLGCRGRTLTLPHADSVMRLHLDGVLRGI